MLHLDVEGHFLACLCTASTLISKCLLCRSDDCTRAKYSAHYPSRRESLPSCKAMNDKVESACKVLSKAMEEEDPERLLCPILSCLVKGGDKGGGAEEALMRLDKIRSELVFEMFLAKRIASFF